MCENTRAMENLEDKICAFLKRKEAGTPLKTLEIAKGVGLKTAKDVNRALYSLQGKGRLQKVGDSPPLWSLGGPSRSAAVNDTPNPTGTPSKHKIKTILKSHTGREGVTAKELARDLNQPSRAVNAQLYDMLSRGEVEKSRLSKDGSFSWKCTDEDGSNNNKKEESSDAPGDSITSTFDESSDSDTSVSTFSWFQKNYSSVKKLGEGGFGSVFIAKKKIDETDYAIKVVEFDKHASREVKALAHFNHPNIVRYFTAWEESSPLQSSESGESTDEEDETESTNASSKSKFALREVQALASFQHPNIVRYFTAWIESSPPQSSESGESTDEWNESASTNASSKSNAPKTYLYIQMEYCGGGTLNKWITERNSGVTRSKKEALDIFQKIVNGVEYIHSQEHFHRDLKPDNILFGSDGTVKIGDFGLVTTITNRNGASIERTMGKGTETYMSPEQEDQSTYDEKVDIFPLGLIFFELLWRIGTGMERAKLWVGLRRGELPEEFRKEYTTEHVLIRKMLSEAPANRPGAKDISKQLNVLLKEQTFPIPKNITV